MSLNCFCRQEINFKYGFFRSTTKQFLIYHNLLLPIQSFCLQHVSFLHPNLPIIFQTIPKHLLRHSNNHPHPPNPHIRMHSPSATPTIIPFSFSLIRHITTGSGIGIATQKQQRRRKRARVRGWSDRIRSNECIMATGLRKFGPDATTGKLGIRAEKRKGCFDQEWDTGAVEREKFRGWKDDGVGRR